MGRICVRGGEQDGATSADVATALEEMSQELARVLADSECEINALAGGFAELASVTHSVLDDAASVVQCAEGSAVVSLPARVEQLDRATRSFLEERLTATAGILETVTSEAALLARLARQTQAQRAVAKETEMLRVLTNIEVARLGAVGASFEYLAHELSDFSEAVAGSTAELMGHTEERCRTVEETRHTLARELPRMREEFGRTEEGLTHAVSAVSAIVHDLAERPGHFRRCVEEIAEQIAGVVAAIQAHDITRQQIEHVEKAMGAIALELRDVSADGGAAGAAGKRTEAALGLRIQSYQLRGIRETVEGWTEQIRSCLAALGHIASSEVLEMAPAVLAEERRLSVQLSGLERVEEACAVADAKVRSSFAGITGLMQLVNEHLERSRSVRDRLQLLMFNSIVEASHLGTQADGILEISTTIKRIASDWSGINSRSETAMAEIAALVDASGTALAVFEGGRGAEVSEAGTSMHEGLKILRCAAACAETKGREIQEQIGALRQKLAGVSGPRDRLEECFRRLSALLDGLEQVRDTLPSGEEAGSNREAIAQRFSADYTTETEREVLRAALAGGPLPTGRPGFAGNSVELF